VYIVRETFDPRPVEIFLMLAPMNAAVYGAVGSGLGFVRVAFFRTTEASPHV
jgi:hypothetical protein